MFSYVRKLVMRDQSTNIQLLGELGVHLHASGHDFKIITKTLKEVIQKLEKIVLNDWARKAKKDREKMKREQKITFVKEWTEEHQDMLVEGGLEGTTILHKFVSGIFLCTSAAKINIPL